MLRKGFKKIIGKKTSEVEDLPLILALNMEKLEQDVEEKSFIPIICAFCGAIVSDTSSLKKMGNSISWNCEFCGNDNKYEITNMEVLEEKEKTEGKSEDLHILFKEIQEPTAKTEEDSEIKKDRGEALIAIIDVSGSMFRGKLEAVKHSLIQTIKNLKVNNPSSVFVLITFTSEVSIYSTPHEHLEIRKEEHIFSEANLENFLIKELENAHVGPVSEFGDEWIRKIEQLTPLHYTALGPALFCGQILTERKILKRGKKSARLILLTDGLANVGMGMIEGGNKSKAEEFYSNLANRARQKGVIMDLIGVDDGSSQMALDLIGKITDITGGEVSLISKDLIESTFKHLESKNYIARNAILRVFYPDFLELEEIEGIYVQNIPKKSGVPISLGALDPNRELYLKFHKTKSTTQKKADVQIQLDYLDRNDVKKTRLLHSTYEITDDVSEFKDYYDSELITNLELQKANKLVQQFQMEEAKKKLAKMRKTLASDYYVGTQNLSSASELIDSEEEEWKEIIKRSQNVGETKGAFFSGGQARYRHSLEARKKEVMDKKKKK
ncbi:MAG: hypothetical protein JW776_04260 [Candidatus Lokiarchaeota archaeon]|nr:hypothetical protein [Candidatus Lokiarchaeota archaeon]